MLYCSSECGSISIMRSYAQFIATRMYIEFMCAYMFTCTYICYVIPLIYIEMLISNISKKYCSIY